MELTELPLLTYRSILWLSLATGTLKTSGHSFMTSTQKLATFDLSPAKICFQKLRTCTPAVDIFSGNKTSTMWTSKASRTIPTIFSISMVPKIKSITPFLTKTPPSPLQRFSPQYTTSTALQCTSGNFLELMRSTMSSSSFTTAIITWMTKRLQNGTRYQRNWTFPLCSTSAASSFQTRTCTSASLIKKEHTLALTAKSVSTSKETENPINTFSSTLMEWKLIVTSTSLLNYPESSNWSTPLFMENKLNSSSSDPKISTTTPTSLYSRTDFSTPSPRNSLMTIVNSPTASLTITKTLNYSKLISSWQPSTAQFKDSKIP